MRKRQPHCANAKITNGEPLLGQYMHAIWLEKFHFHAYLFYHNMLIISHWKRNRKFNNCLHSLPRTTWNGGSSLSSSSFLFSFFLIIKQIYRDFAICFETLCIFPYFCKKKTNGFSWPTYNIAKMAQSLKATDWVFHAGRDFHVWCNF